MKEETNRSLEMNNINEQWSIIPDYTNYEASTMGRIRILTTGRILTPSINPVTGYANVSVKRDDGKYVMRYVHRLVL